MSAKRKQKGRSRRNGAKNVQRKRSNLAGEGATTAVETKVAPEELVGAIVESLTAPLLGATPPSEGAPDEAILSDCAVEHRAHPRVTVAVAIGLESESHFFSGLSGDISEGGVFVQTYRELPVGSDVEVRFDLPEGELSARGRVRWHRVHSDSSPPGLGIAFDELDERDRLLIQRFCEHRAPLYYDL